MSEPLAAGRLDTYSKRARLAPAMLVILPVELGFIPWFGLHQLPFVFVAVLAGAGITILFAEIVRDLGKRHENDLFRTWGGSPTLDLLRHRGNLGNPQTRLRYHQSLSQLIPGASIPTPESELDNPQRADETYESCVHFLREQTRNRSDFPLVFAENASYGFRRNMFGLRKIGTASAFLGLALSASALGSLWNTNGRWEVAAIVGLANAGLVVFWATWVTPNWVRRSAIAYAERLIGACELLTKQHSKRR
jgi:hypothetical protein